MTNTNLKNIRKFQSYFKANWELLRKKHNVRTWKAIRKILRIYIFFLMLGNYRKVRKCVTKNKQDMFYCKVRNCVIKLNIL